MKEPQRRPAELGQPCLHLDSIYTLLFAVAGWRSGLAPLSDNSFLCHLRTGSWIIRKGIPRVDVFSFTVAGRRWVDESWLADLIYGFLDRISDAFGLAAFHAAMCAAIGALWYRLALRLCGDRTNAAIITALSLGASWTVWSTRPLLSAILAFLLLVSMVESNVSGLRLMWIAPLMWTWTNIHGSFALGFGYLGLHLAGQWAEGHPPWAGRERVLALVALASFGLCFLNPYGGGLITEPLHLLERRSVLQYVVEWRPARPASIQALMYLVWLVTLAVCVALGPRRGLIRDLIVSLPFIALGVATLRGIAIAPLVTMPAAARALVSRRWSLVDSRPAVNATLAALIAALAVFWTIRSTPRFDFSGYPVDAMRAVDAHGLLGRRLLSTDQWGDYIIYQYWPRQRVFIDDRYNLYSAPIFLDMLMLLNGKGDWHAVLERYEIDVVVWPAEPSAIEALEREPQWHRVYADSNAVVYARAASNQRF